MRSIEWYVGSIANDHRLPITPHFLHFAPPFMTLYKMCAPRDFELGILADHSKSQPSDNKKLSYRSAEGPREHSVSVEMESTTARNLKKFATGT